MQYSAAVRDAALDARVDRIGPAPVLELREDATPARCSSPSRGTLLARGSLPEVYMLRAQNGVKSMLGRWQIIGVARGTAGHFRLFDATGVCHAQGNIPTDMEADSTSIEPGQVVTVTLFNLRSGNA